MTTTMSSWGVRKPIRTYSRQGKRSFHDGEPPSKRRRVDAGMTAVRTEKTVKSGSEEPTISSSPAHDASEIPISSPEESPAIFSDEPQLKSTPPSSPLPQKSSPPMQARRPTFSFLRRKPDSKLPTKEPLRERSHNVLSPTKPPKNKTKRLVQMQLDLVGELRKTCKVCGMQYIPSNAEDARLHRKFHDMNVGGVEFTKANVEKLKSNQVWIGGDGSFVTVIGRKDTRAIRNKAGEVLKVVNTELGAVAIPEEALWSQTRIPIAAEPPVEGKQTNTKGEAARGSSDRFKFYLYVRGLKCVGACLAERIHEAYAVLGQDDASGSTGRLPADPHSSSISVAQAAEPAILGISRIWTSSSHRKRGIATRLLNSASSDFLYGMDIEKKAIAFSQPTESGGQLARKWFGQQAGWHVYID